MGRPPLGKTAMTAAERQRRHRARSREANADPDRYMVIMAMANAGGKQRPLRTFGKVMELLIHTCEQCVDVDVPPITAQQKAVVLAHLQDVRAALGDFANRIKESSQV